MLDSNRCRRAGAVMQSRSSMSGVWVLVLVLLVPTSVAAQTETVEYYASDAIGSVRVVFNASGVVLGRMDYAPFGGELYTGVLMPAERFADLDRDGESGLNYAEARMYRHQTGRFNSPDPLFTVVNPQTLNRYSYSLNNPTKFTDSAGLFPVPICFTCFLIHSESVTVTGRAPDLVATQGGDLDSMLAQPGPGEQTPSGPGWDPPLGTDETEALTNSLIDLISTINNPSDNCETQVFNRIAGLNRPALGTYLSNGVRFRDGTKSNSPAATTLYPPVAAASFQRQHQSVTTISSYFATEKGMTAATPITGGDILTIYIRPGTVDTSSKGANARNRGFLLHEALHGFGAVAGRDFGHEVLGKAFNVDPTPSVRISNYISTHCK